MGKIEKPKLDAKQTQLERQQLKREESERVLDDYFEKNLHLGIESLKNARVSRPEATPREILTILQLNFLNGLKTAEHASAKASLYQDFILGSLAIHKETMDDEARRAGTKLLKRKLAGLKRNATLKGVANGVGIVAEIAIEFMPFFKNAKFLKKIKNVKPASVEKGAKLVAQAGVAAVGKVVNSPRGSNGDPTVNKLSEILGPAPKSWPKAPVKKK